MQSNWEDADSIENRRWLSYAIPCGGGVNFGLGRCLAAFLFCVIGLSLASLAQPASKTDFQLSPGLPGLGSASRAQPVYEATVELPRSVANGAREETQGRLRVKVTLPKGVWIYSTTQKPGGPLKTRIGLEAKGVSVAGPFTPDHEPKAGPDSAFGNLSTEKFFDQVIWSAPVNLEAGISVSDLKLSVKIDGQYCSGLNCTLIDTKVDAKVVHPEDRFADVQAKPFRDPNGNVNWTAVVSRTKVRPGDTFDVTLIAEPQPSYHIYSVRVDEQETNFRTVIIVSQKNGLKFGLPEPSSQPVIKDVAGEKYELHEGKVAWRIPVKVPSNAQAGKYMFEGLVGYQACTDESCDMPLGLQVAGEVTVGTEAGNQSAALTIAKKDFKDIKAHPNRLTWVDKESSAVQSFAALPLAQLFGYFATAMLGGLILNFMPCVLPVIGLKVMGFVQEGGGDARRTAMLNFWYVLGLLSVIMGFAIAIVFARDLLGMTIVWGEQFSNAYFRMAMAILVFAMALSFLGVWEIPIPGFATTQQSGAMLEREGIAGAFSKGVLTTLLSIPCSGPFLGSVLALTLTQPSWVILLMFLGIGLGFSMPYLIVAFWPSAIRWLPKPGSWMDTLKQALAFPLLFTAIYFVCTFANEYRIAAMSALIVVWFSCWMIGKLPAWAEMSSKLKMWGSALAVGAIGVWACFTYLGPQTKYLEWEPYSEHRLVELTEQGKTVMVDFTAEWCPTCKWNLSYAIDTKKVSKLVEQLGVVPMLADMTNSPPEVKAKLTELGAASIPILAIYPAHSPKEPVLMPDVLTESEVLNAISNAGGDQVLASVSDESRLISTRGAQ